MPLAYSSIFMFSQFFFQFVWWCFSRILAFSSQGFSFRKTGRLFVEKQSWGSQQPLGMMEQPGSEKILEADMILLALGFLGRAVLVVVGGLETWGNFSQM